MLGQGGMGSVFLARHPRLGRLTALKLLNRELFADREIRARFEREADLVAQLDHPNIVEVYDRGTEDEQLWISMQFIDGVDAAGVNVTQLPPERAVQIIEGVADALDYAHARGVLHRDVKPANIILARAVAGHGERVFLTDFGIARLREDSTHLTQRGMFTATLAYASPEQMTGGHLDHTTDQYSLACALYWLLIGAGPYDSPHPGELIRGHLQLLPPPVSLRRPGLTQAMDAVLTKAMAKRPADRFPSCSDFAKAARHALTNTTPIHPGTPYTVAPPIYGAPPVGAYPAPPGYAPAPNYPPQQPQPYPPAPQPYPAPQQPGAQPGQAYSPVPQPGVAPGQAYAPAQQPPGAAPVPPQPHPAPQVPGAQQPAQQPAAPNYQVPQLPPAQPGADASVPPGSGPDQSAPLDDSAFRPTDSFPTHRAPADSPSPDSASPAGPTAQDPAATDSDRSATPEPPDSPRQLTAQPHPPTNPDISTGPTDSFPTRRADAESPSASSESSSSDSESSHRSDAPGTAPGSEAGEPDSSQAEESVPVETAAPAQSGGSDSVSLTSGESAIERTSDSDSDGASSSAGAAGKSSGYPDAAQRNPESGAFVPSAGKGATPPSQPAVVPDAADPDRVWARGPGAGVPPSEPVQASDPSAVSSAEPARTPDLGPVPPAPQFIPPGFPVNSAPPQQVPESVGRSQLTALVVLAVAALVLLLLLAVVVVQVAG
ncbi:protein kinase [Nocardia sp. NPDC056000]|uniref:serine/threonine-protein kinase n=1 Tax=Nocardia sp. NPDC056000 TaxID=3345674 RepID=UPI0035D93169